MAGLVTTLGEDFHREAARAIQSMPLTDAVYSALCAYDAIEKSWERSSWTMRPWWVWKELPDYTHKDFGTAECPGVLHFNFVGLALYSMGIQMPDAEDADMRYMVLGPWTREKFKEHRSKHDEVSVDELERSHYGERLWMSWSYILAMDAVRRADYEVANNYWYSTSVRRPPNRPIRPPQDPYLLGDESTFDADFLIDRIGNDIRRMDRVDTRRRSGVYT